MKKSRFIWLGILLTVLTAYIIRQQAVTAYSGNVVNVYSSRKEALLQDVLKQFTDVTGIKVNLVTDSASKILERMKAEGSHSPADLLLTSDIMNLQHAKALGLLQTIHSGALINSIPPSLRDPDNQWFALSLRVRAIFYAKDRVDPSELSTYFALSNPRWRNKLLTRSSSNVYNQSLIASIISQYGITKAETWGKGIVANLARKPQGGDTDQLRALAAGQGDIAIANSYYFGRLMDSNVGSDRTVIKKVGIFLPKKPHINISGGGVAKYAPHKRNAIKLLTYLSSPAAQKIYAKVNHEYPVIDTTPISDIVQSWGPLNREIDNISLLYVHRDTALKLADRVGWR